MNKKTIDCIQADIDRKNKEKKEKEELILKIYDFFKDLPEGEYGISINKSIEKKVRDHWYSKSWTKYIKVSKEPWLDSFTYIIIRKKDKIEISDRIGSIIHNHDITQWSANEVQIFYNHLDWFENELAKEYCNGEKHNNSTLF